MLYIAMSLSSKKLLAGPVVLKKPTICELSQPFTHLFYLCRDRSGRGAYYSLVNPGDDVDVPCAIGLYGSRFRCQTAASPLKAMKV